MLYSPESRTEMKFARMNAINVVLLMGVASMFLLFSDALKETGNVTFTKEIKQGCAGSCCISTTTPCMNTYKAAGMWTSKNDTSMGLISCRSGCQRHYNRCRNVCLHLAKYPEVEDANRCKCVTTDIPAFTRACFTQCRIAFLKCRIFCKKNGPCACAETTIDIDIDADGSCSPIVCQGPPAGHVCMIAP